MSFGWIVTRFAWMQARFVSAISDTMYASVASWIAMMALLWKRRPSFCALDTSRTRRWNGAHWISRLVLFWNLRISRIAHVPGRQRRCAFFTPDAPLGAFLLFFDVMVRFARAVSLVRDMVWRGGVGRGCWEGLVVREDAERGELWVSVKTMREYARVWGGCR
ncbi:histone H3, putative [Leishmania tarentolae]|uniref:Histone H3, putative n=1 Tax=Leishmania tarentolae TaxID=5689 RepID=A0A640KDB3_LEITA|nr:histone H3, putative [Leishmania tarentolae]